MPHRRPGSGKSHTRRKSFPVLQRREDTTAWTRTDRVSRQAHRPCGTPLREAPWAATVPGVGSAFPHSNAPRSPPSMRHGTGLPRAVPSSHARPTPAALAEAARALPPEGGTPTGCARPGRGRGGTGLRSVGTLEHWMQYAMHQGSDEQRKTVRGPPRRRLGNGSNARRAQGRAQRTRRPRALPRGRRATETGQARLRVPLRFRRRICHDRLQGGTRARLACGNDGFRDPVHRDFSALGTSPVMARNGRTEQPCPAQGGT